MKPAQQRPRPPGRLLHACMEPPSGVPHDAATQTTPPSAVLARTPEPLRQSSSVLFRQGPLGRGGATLSSASALGYLSAEAIPAWEIGRSWDSVFGNPRLIGRIEETEHLFHHPTFSPRFNSPRARSPRQDETSRLFWQPPDRVALRRRDPTKYRSSGGKSAVPASGHSDSGGPSAVEGGEVQDMLTEGLVDVADAGDVPAVDKALPADPLRLETDTVQEQQQQGEGGDDDESVAETASELGAGDAGAQPANAAGATKKKAGKPKKKKDGKSSDRKDGKGSNRSDRKSPRPEATVEQSATPKASAPSTSEKKKGKSPTSPKGGEPPSEKKKKTARAAA